MQKEIGQKPDDYCDHTADMIDYKFNIAHIDKSWPLRANCTFDDAFEISVTIEKQCFNMSHIDLLFDEKDFADPKCQKLDSIVS